MWSTWTPEGVDVWGACARALTHGSGGLPSGHPLRRATRLSPIDVREAGSSLFIGDSHLLQPIADRFVRSVEGAEIVGDGVQHGARLFNALHSLLHVAQCVVEVTDVITDGAQRSAWVAMRPTSSVTATT